MRSAFGLVLIFSLMSFIACEKKNFFSYSEEDVMLVESLSQDFRVPDEIWHYTKPKNEAEKQKPIIYTMARVLFKEKNKGILKSPLMVLEFPRGGGEIDLSEITTGESGTFYLNFEFSEAEKPLQTKVFFISQSRQRKVDGEIIGSGCKKALDITKAFKDAQAKEGLKVNTTRLRHVSLLGGHFIILIESEKNWMMTQVTFFDSNRSDLFCPDFRNLE